MRSGTGGGADTPLTPPSRPHGDKPRLDSGRLSGTLPTTETDQPGEDRSDLVGLLQRLGPPPQGLLALAERDTAGPLPREPITYPPART